eukprot:3392977-Rhodomonas_salina.1
MRYANTAHCGAQKQFPSSTYRVPRRYPGGLSLVGQGYLAPSEGEEPSVVAPVHEGTAHRVAPYARPVPHDAKNHTLDQYRTTHSTIRSISTALRSTTRSVSTARLIAPYTTPVPQSLAVI